MSGAPIGEVFELDGKQYHVQPRVFSSRTMEALGRLYKAAMRNQIQENLKTAAEIRKTDPKVYDDFMKEVIRHATSRVFVGYEQAIEALSTREGMILALTHNCEQTPDQESATALVDAAPNIIDLMSVIIQSGNEALEAAKNSYSPENEGDQEEIPVP